MDNSKNHFLKIDQSTDHLADIIGNGDIQQLQCNSQRKKSVENISIKRVANTRNPFSRLFSGWRDKSRTHLLENGEIDFSAFNKGRFGRLAKNPNEIPKQDLWDIKYYIRKRSKDFHEKYFNGIEVFEEKPIQKGFNYSWEGFVKYVAANPGNHAQNHHWKSLFYQCNPCQIRYNYITHLESSTTEWPYLLKRLKINDETYIPGKYEWAPATKDELAWSTIPRRTAQIIYQHYFADFILFGYSPDSVLGFINAANDSLQPPKPEINRKSRQILESLVKDDLNGNEDFICNEPDTGTIVHNLYY